MYPLMLFTLIIYRGKDNYVFKFLFLGFCVFCSFIGFHQNFGRGIQMVVVGTRYLLPILFVGIITYSWLLDVLQHKISKSGIIILLLINLLCIPYIFLSASHYKYQREYLDFKDFLYQSTTDNALILTDTQVPKLLEPFWGSQNWMWLVKSDTGGVVPGYINKAFKNNRNVYIALLVRPFRESINQRAIQDKNELLNEFPCALYFSKQSSAGRLEIYKLKPPS